MKNVYPFFKYSCSKVKSIRLSFLLLLPLLIPEVIFASVSVTAPSLTAYACGSSFPTPYSALGNIVITEGANGDFANQSNVTLILTVPANFEFNPGIGSVVATSGNNIVTSPAPSITVTSTTITISYSVSGTNRQDILTISGIQIRGINTLSSGNITRTIANPGTGTIAGITNGTTNFGTLTSSNQTVPSVTSASSGTVCSGVAQNYSITSGVAGTTYSWGRAAVAGISEGTVSNQTANPIIESLTNTTNSPVAVTYSITPIANGCPGSAFNYVVTVNPKPSVTNGSTASTCSGTGPGITLAANVPSSFAWTIGTVVNGITGASASSGGAINQTLTNPSSTLTGSVQYLVTPTATTGSCVGAASTITVTVNPLPVVTTAASQNACSGVAPSIALTASVASSFTWTIGTITGGITGASAGSGSTINQVLTNPSNSAAGTVQYIVTPTSSAGSCPGNPYTITVTVNPSPVVTTANTASTCSGTGPGISLAASAASSFAWTLGTNTGGITGATAASGIIINQTLTNPSNSTAGSIVYNVTPTTTTGSCAGAVYPITVTVNPKPSVTNGSTAGTCSGTGPGIVLSASAPSSFAWTIGTVVNGITGASASSGGTINQILTNPSSTLTGSVQYLVTPTATTGSCVGTASTITVTVNPLPVVTTAASQNACSGVAPSIALTASVASSFTWTIGTITGGITGASAGSGSTINQVLTNPSNSAAGTVQYIVTPTSSAGSCPGNPYTITVTVNPSPVVTTSSTAAICSGTGTGISLTASTASSFTWTVGTVTGGITTPSGGSGSTINQTLTNPSNAAAGSVVYNVVPTATTGSCVGASYPITVTVNPKPAVTTPTTASTCNGTGPNISLTASAPSSFAWTIGTIVNGITGASASSGGTINQVLNNPSATTNGSVQYLVTPTATTGSCVGSATTITVTVTPTPVVTTASTKSTCSGTGPNISLTASVASSFTWTIGTITGGITGASAGSGSTINQVLTNPDNSAAGTVQYIVTPTSTTGSCPGNPYTITVTVNPSPVVTTANTASTCSGTGPAISLTASAASSFAWTLGTNTGGITGATTASGTTINQTLTNPSNSTAGSIVYNVTPTATTGSCAGAVYPITVTVNPKPVMTSAGSATVCSGSALNFPLTASAGSTFTWIATDNASTTGESTTLQASSVINDVITNNTTSVKNVLYTVSPTSTPQGCTGTAQTVTVAVYAPPVITTQPNPLQTVCATFPVSFTVAATGDGLTYQWYKGATPLTDAGFISGSATATLSINPTTLGDAGTYHVVVSGTAPCSAAISADAVLDVHQEINITTQPTPSQTWCEGQSASFTVASTGTSLSYQWQKAGSPLTDDGVNIIGSNSVTLTLNNLVPGDAGSYNVVITDAAVDPGDCNIAFSNPAALAVNKKSADPTSISTTSLICNGSSATLTLVGGGGGTGEVITWYAGSCGGTPIGTGNGFTVSPTTTTTYYGRYEDPAPCSYNSACVSATVTVNQKSGNPTSTTPSTICNGQSALLTLSGGGGGDAETIKWYTASTGGTLVGTGNGFSVSPTVTTTYYGGYEDGAPCNYNTPRIPVTITVNQKPADPTGATASSTLICNGSSATLTLSGGGGGTGQVINWYSGSCGGTLVGTGNGLAVSPATTTTYYGRYETSAPCSYNSNCQPVALTISVNQPPTTANAGSALTSCVTSPAVTLSANTPTVGTGAWSITGGPNTSLSQLSSTSNPTATFTATTSGTYTLRWTISNSPCTASFSNVTVTVYALPSTANAGTNQDVCSISTALAAVNPTVGTGQWSIVSGPSLNLSQFSNIASRTATFTSDAGLTATGTYVLRWTVSNGPCAVSTSDVTIKLNPPITNNSLALLSVCRDPSTGTVSPIMGTATGSVSGGTGTYTFSWARKCQGDGGFFAVSGTTETIIIPQNSTNCFYQRAVVSGPCSNVSPGSGSDGHINTNALPSTFSYVTPQTGTGSYCKGGTGIAVGTSASIASVAPTANTPGYTSYYELFRDNVSTGIILTGNGSPLSFGLQTIAGTYTVTETITLSSGSQGCGVSTFPNSFVLKIDSNVTASIAPPVTPVCDTVTLTGNTPAYGSGTWTVTTGTGTFSNAATPVTTVTNMVVGSNTFKWKVVNGTCADSASVTVSSTKPNIAPTALNTSIATICKGSSVTLTQTGGTLGTGASWKWYSDPAYTTLVGSGAGASASLLVSPLVTTTYYLRAEGAAGPCQPITAAATSVTVTVNQPSTAPVSASASPATICNGDAANLTQTGGVLGTGAYWQWYSGAGFTTPVGGQLTSPNASLSVSPALTTTYYVRIEGGAAPCSTTPTAAVNTTVTVNQPNIVPTTLSTSANPICNGGSTTLTQNGGILGTGGSWKWYSDPTYTTLAGTGAGASASLSVSPVVTTTYYLRMEGNAAPCATNTPAGSITVTVNPRPTSVLSGTTTICAGNTATLSVNLTGSSPWSLTLSDGTVYTGIIASPFTFSVTPAATTSYTITALSDANCTSIAADRTGGATVTVNPLPTASIAGTITVCPAAGTQNITFTGANGTPRYTFTYTINGGAPQTVTTAPGNSTVTVVQAINTPGTYTYALVSVQDESSTTCSQVQSGTATITVTQPPVNIQNQTLTGCSGGAVSFTATDGVPTVATIVPAGTVYSWSVPALPAGVSGATAGTNAASFSQTLTNTSSTVQSVTYTITPYNGGCPGTPFNVTINVDPALPAGTAVWTGAAGSDWCNPANWACGILPDAGTNALIPAGATNMPVVNCVNAYVKDITVQPGATLDIPTGQTLNIFGAITNTDATRYTLNGTVNFAGASQTIPAFTYSGLSVSGTGNKTLAGAVMVNGLLDLIGGYIVSTPANMLTISTTGSVSAGSDQSYISGPLTRLTDFPKTYYFPVGGGGDVRVGSVTPADGTLSSYTVYYSTVTPGGTMGGADLFGTQTTDSWSVQKNYGIDATPGFYYEDPNGLPESAPTTDWTTGFNPCLFCNVAVTELTGSSWYYTGGISYPGGFGPTESNYWQSPNFVDSRVQITDGTVHTYSFGYGYIIVLPITLETFTGTLQGNNGLLQWKFGTGSDIPFTELQHSRDGQHFSKLAERPAIANLNSYDYLDKNLVPGSHFYRLKMRDNAGKYSMSKTVLLVAGKTITVIKGLRPVMVRNETFVDIISAIPQSVTTIMYDAAGKAVAENKGSLNQGSNSFRINTALLAQGLYTLQVQTADGAKAVLRFVKE